MSYNPYKNCVLIFKNKGLKKFYRKQKNFFASCQKAILDFKKFGVADYSPKGKKTKKELRTMEQNFKREKLMEEFAMYENIKNAKLVALYELKEEIF